MKKEMRDVLVYMERDGSWRLGGNSPGAVPCLMRVAEWMTPDLTSNTIGDLSIRYEILRDPKTGGPLLKDVCSGAAIYPEIVAVGPSAPSAESRASGA